MSDFQKITTIDNLYQCWMKVRKNKSHRARIQRFGDDPLRYLVDIQQRLRARTYEFGPYTQFTVKEKKFRDVVDAPMKDRIVHWMLYGYLLPIYSRRFIHDTYGNLPGRGTHAAVKRLAEFARKEKNTWSLKVDVSKYFYSVRHEILYEKTVKSIGDHDVRQLIRRLIDSYVTDSRYDDLFPPNSVYHQHWSKGMPIGNLTSQLFANLYLDEFDHWVKEEKRIRCYVRYVDDMVILGESKAALSDLLEALTARLEKEGLVIHPHKIRLAPITEGVPFLGYQIWSNHISAGKYLRSRYLKRLREHETGVFDRSVSLDSYRAMLTFTGTNL